MYPLRFVLLCQAHGEIVLSGFVSRKREQVWERILVNESTGDKECRFGGDCLRNEERESPFGSGIKASSRNLEPDLSH